ncbi:MAG: POTRA domain-containing protein [Terriglobales bacterium]|jgi:outer membrane protein insertion porin family
MNRVVANRVASSLLSLSLLVSPGAAQKPPTSRKTAPVTADKLIALKATRTTRYTGKEILAASGLELGQSAADGDFKEAVRRLGDTGLFAEIVYSFSSSDAGVKLDLQLTDIDPSKLVPAHFENFVWFTDAELLTAVQHRVPLFKGLLPLSGNLPDRVSEALQAILTEKHFPGRVDFLRVGDESGGALHAVDYHVEEVSIRIRKLEFPGASPEQTTLLTVAARRLTGAEYGRSVLAATAKLDLLPVYLQRGYLKAAFGPSDARIVPEKVPDTASQSAPAADEQANADLEVDAIVPVTPGKMYSTSGVDWKGNSTIAIAEVAPLVHLTPGQPADAVRLLLDLENVAKLYRSRGYMAVQVTPEPHFDDDKSTVRYDLNIVEGYLYKMGELEILGLDTQAKARMVDAWTLREGQPYNANYLKKFLADTGPLLPRGADWAVSTHETLDAKDKTVEVEIRFKQQ